MINIEPDKSSPPYYVAPAYSAESEIISFAFSLAGVHPPDAPAYVCANYFWQ